MGGKGGGNLSDVDAYPMQETLGGLLFFSQDDAGGRVVGWDLQRVG